MTDWTYLGEERNLTSDEVAVDGVYVGYVQRVSRYGWSGHRGSNMFLGHFFTKRQAAQAVADNRHSGHRIRIRQTSEGWWQASCDCGFNSGHDGRRASKLASEHLKSVAVPVWAHQAGVAPTKITNNNQGRQP